MKICFQADADLNQAIVTGILRREPSIDFQTANASNLRGLTDLEVLSFVAKEKRVLVSHDQRTIKSSPRLTHPTNYKILLSPQVRENQIFIGVSISNDF